MTPRHLAPKAHPLLRNSAALLMTLSGIGHFASLWFRELTPEALLSAAIGAVYLFIGIGLYGQSRFTLFVAMLVPALVTALQYRHTQLADLSQLQTTALLINAFVILACAYILWQVRHQPSV